MPWAASHAIGGVTYNPGTQSVTDDNKHIGGNRLMAPGQVDSYAINTKKTSLKQSVFFATVRWYTVRGL